MIEKAVELLHQQLRSFYGELFNVIFEHADEAGYWFSYELIGAPTRQTWCVRHHDLTSE